MGMNNSVNLSLCESILDGAAGDGRSSLLEYEGFEFLAAMGLSPPRWSFIRLGEKIDPGAIAKVKTTSAASNEVVVKIVSPAIAHKTEVGGVRMVKGTAVAVKAAIKAMSTEIPSRAASGASGLKGAREADSRQAVRGFLVEQRLFPESGFGGELLMGVRWTDAFGPVLVFGPGGIHSETWAENIAAGRGAAMRSAIDADEKSLASMLDDTLIGDFLMGRTRAKNQLLEPALVTGILERFAEVAIHFSPGNPVAAHHVVELEVNPFILSGGELRPVDVLLRFKPASQEVAPMPTRPLSKIKKLLCPKSVALVGVSEKGLNIGRIILNNLLGDGYPRQNIFIVKPGFSGSVDGCACFDSVAKLPRPVDLIAVSVDAASVPQIVSEIEQYGAAAGVLLIPGGMGEKDGSETIEARIADEIKRARAAGGGAVYNGGNCIGIISQPGGCDTNFVPGYKLPRSRASLVNTAIISQSGALIDSWLSKHRLFRPRYAVSIGNQIDITISDYLRAFRDDDGVEVVAIYVEGFRPGDGLETAREIAALCASGREVVVYKAGRTKEGRASASGHTASIAGDSEAATAILGRAGAWIAETFEEIENATKLCSFLHGRVLRGSKIGAISNAGFEVVGVADNTGGGPRPLQLASFGATTRAKLENLFARAGIQGIADVRNPLDATPMSGDRLFAEYADAILEDSDVDIGVVSVVPLSWLMNTLEKSGGVHAEDVEAPTSIARRLAAISRKNGKPIIGIVNAGSLYDRMVDIMEEALIPVFREADQAMFLLAKFVDLRFRLSAVGGQSCNPTTG